MDPPGPVLLVLVDVLADEDGRHGDRVRHRGEPDPGGQRPRRHVVGSTHHERPPDEEDPRLAEPVVLQLERRRDVEDAHEQARERERGDGPAARPEQDEADRYIGEVAGEDRRLEPGLADQP